ncbi:MAG: hypothetical protein M3R00_03445, partial [Pseudomonadota bacterium]|nr:hypothetical protein [Pseudomonadota bacterium]
DFASGNKTFLDLSYAPIIPPIGEARDALGQNYLVIPAVRLALITGESPAFTAQMNAYTAGLVTQQKIPVLIIYGAGDRIVNPGVFEDLGQHIVGSKSIAYPGQGHLPQLTNSLRFNIDLDNFIDRYARY